VTAARQLSRHSGPIPVQAGIGLRAPHYRELLERRPDIGWVEVHSENYFGSGGQPLYYLERVRQHYPLSLHGVGLSLGSTDPLNRWHLERLKSLISRVEPVLVSEHLSWSSVGGRYLNDLLPLPYTEEALRHVSDRIDQAQESLGRTLLIENISSYLQFTQSTIPEWEFLAQLVRRTGCGLLLDVNNVYVTNPNTSVVGLRNDNTNSNNRSSNLFIENGSFLRCKNITLGYRLPERVLSTVHLQSFRVFATVTNAFIVTNISGMDPEIGSWNPLQAGWDQGYYPQQRMYTIGANIGFAK